MKKSSKILLAVGGFGFLAVALSSCTTSFCSTKDRTRVGYTYDVYNKTQDIEKPIEGGGTTIVTEKVDGVFVHGISTYWDPTDTRKDRDLTHPATQFTFTDLDGISYNFTNIYVSYNKNDNLFIKDMETNLKSSKAYIKVNDFTNFYKEMDNNFLSMSLIAWNASEDRNLYTEGVNKETNQLTPNDLHNILVGTTFNNKALQGFGFLKYCGSKENGGDIFEYWQNQYDKLLKVIPYGADACPDSDYITYYKNQMISVMNSTNSCIATQGGFYGYYGYNDANKTSVFIEAKDWNYAWHLHNFPLLEGLFVFPISWLIDTITNGFMGAGDGVAQLLAILVVTFILRALLFAATFKSTSSQAKMQELQPEISRIQAKYPNANTNKAEKQALAQETNELYKKHGVKPFSSLIALFVQFPVFICVWGAMQGSAVLSSGSFCGLYLSQSVSSVLFNVNGWPNLPGWWTALVLFLIMAGLQVLSMLLPQIIQKRKAKKAVAQTGKNPAVQKQGNKMKWFTIIMVVMVIFMGFSLASGMVVYWIAGSLFSIAQTLIVEYISNRKAKNKKNGPKKPKKEKVAVESGDATVIEAEVCDVPDIYAAPTGKKKFKDNKNK